MKTFTIQFDYDGKTRTYTEQCYNEKISDAGYEMIAYHLVEVIVEKENYKKDGVIASNIKLFDNEGTVLFNSNNNINR